MPGQKSAKLIDQLGFQAALIPEITTTHLTVFSLLQLRLPKKFFSLRVPAQVDLMKLLIVGEKNDLCSKLGLNLR